MNCEVVFGCSSESLVGSHFPDLIEETSRNFMNSELMKSDIKTNFRTSKIFRSLLHKSFRCNNKSWSITFKIQRTNGMSLRSNTMLNNRCHFYKIIARLSSKKSTDQMLKNYKEAHDCISESIL
jgi:hypothetical protein